jgi:DASS family divalent anion:Na+ symporter
MSQEDPPANTAVTAGPRLDTPTTSEPKVLWRWAVVVGTAALVLALPRPEDVPPAGWRMLAIFVATIVGAIVQPLPAGAVVLIGVAMTTITGVLTPAQALAGYADPIVWLVLAAFFLSRGMIKTGLGRRLALLFIRAIGGSSLGLSYALTGTDFVLGSIVPSNAARSGGIIFPIATSLAQTYQSTPGPTARRLGAFLLVTVYQCDVIICATFMTGQASNLLIANFATQIKGSPIGYLEWLAGAIVPSLLSLLIVPLLLYRWYPPEVRQTPDATAFAKTELARMGPMSRAEKVMLATFLLVAGLWIVSSWLKLDYTVVALIGIVVLLLSGVLTWEDALNERAAWDVFVWYGGLIRMAAAIGEFGLAKRFALASSQMTADLSWQVAFVLLLLIYFYAHYGFASITAHVTAMYLPFTAVAVAAGTPPVLAAFAFAYCSNLAACLTHYGTTPAPIYFGARYIPQRTWWRLGLGVSLVTITIWGVVGSLWWRVIGLGQ